MLNSHMDLIPKTEIVNLAASTAAILNGMEIANNVALNQHAENESKTLQGEVELLNQSGINPAFLASRQANFAPAGESRAARRLSSSTSITAVPVVLNGETVFIARASFGELAHLGATMPRDKDGLLDGNKPEEAARFVSMALYYGLYALHEGITASEEEAAKLSKSQLVRYFATQDEAEKFVDDPVQSLFVLEAFLAIDALNGIVPRKPAPESEVKAEAPAPRKTRRKGAAKSEASAKRGRPVFA